MNIKDLAVGQVVYTKKINNNARYLRDTKAPIESYIEEVTIEKIGRKFFYITERKGVKFGVGHHDLLFNISDHCASWQVYINKQDIYDEVERTKLLTKIEKVFASRYGHNDKISLDQLRRISSIIEENLTDK